MRSVTNDPWPEVNRARLEAVFQSDAYVHDIGAKLVEWDGGRAVFRLVPEPRHVNFVGSVHGGALFERARTRRTAAYAIDVTSEADGALRATFQAMAFRTGRWHLGEDAWPDEWRATH